MVWFKVDDDLHAHPKVRDAGVAATGLWVMAGSYSAKYGLDGWVPKPFVTGVRGGARLAAKLVAEGLWEPAQRDGKDGWRFHDWDEFQPSAEEVAEEKEAKKASNRERQRRLRERRRAEREAETRNAGRNAPSRVTNAPPDQPRSGVTPDGVTPPPTGERDRNADRNAVTSRVTRSVTAGVTDGGSVVVESAPSRQKSTPQNTPEVLAAHGLTRDEQRDFLAYLKAGNAHSTGAVVAKLRLTGELAGRIDEWRLGVEAEQQAAAAATAPPPGKRTTTHKVRGGLELAAKYRAEEEAAGHPPLIEGA